METVSVSKFKATCLALLKKVQKTGQPILITRRGEPLTQVGPPPPPLNRPRLLGSMKGTVQILGDIVSPDPEDEKLWTYDEENFR